MHDDLEQKYLEGKLTPEELPQLRSAIDAKSNEQIAVDMADRWEGWSETISPELLDNLQERFEEKLSKMNGAESEKANEQGKLRHTVWKFVSIAATILVPILLCALFVYQQKEKALAGQEMAFNTGSGERATATLPDGSKVLLNYESRLSYRTGDFSGNTRNVDFSGEAYFKVSKNPKRPFIINNSKLTVKVMGTQFNLSARPGQRYSTLALDRGLVLISAAGGKVANEVRPGQVAVLDNKTGTVTVNKAEDTDTYKAWLQGNVVFNNASLDEVVARLEGFYGVTISVSGRGSSEKFNGTLPTTDLDGALKVLQAVYGFKYQLDQRQVNIYF